MDTRVKTGRMAALALALWVMVSTLAGCDKTTMGGLGAGWGGYSPYWGGYFPDWGLYDPTQDIQDVINYRQDVMDWSNDAWDEYIRQ